ncbi:MAG TPA: malto-oligosyltrehalose trehalohydrolase [Burkholderiales bacterium]|nr:malto-oligosyltrehalose trehalohydrolase [Burkholderiales bacterium]
MKRLHPMPFGAEVMERGTRFRLWAPDAREVELCLSPGRGERRLAMPAAEAGWFELVTEEAGPGARYQYWIDADLRVSDPASRFNPDDVHGPSEVVDPEAFVWQDATWRGRPWEEAVLYELHVGTFSSEGTFEGARRRLEYLAELGVTAVELMPVADFPGARGWGYDGVLPFAPDSRYGRPEALKQLVQEAHRLGLMMLLDVVYNHFGPEGNYLHRYAPQFFNPRHQTPWGAAINFDGEGNRTVRDFFIHNALYWLEEFHFDGLRFDAVHAILDDSSPHILTELARAVRAGPGRERPVHLVLENDHNEAWPLAQDEGAVTLHTAQWNDDIHHALHVLTVGETDGYYADYAQDPVGRLGRCLTEGFAFQGEASPYRRGARRGEPSRHLPPSAFVAFVQTHDQVGNRAFGERVSSLARPEALRAALAIVLLAPSPPMLFMGEEFGAATPFLYFCDFHGELADAVREGRRREFARFAQFADAGARARIPDPNDAATFAVSRLDWDCFQRAPHRGWLNYYRELLALRRERIQTRLRGTRGGEAQWRRLGERGLAVRWRLGDGSLLQLAAALGDEPVDGFPPLPGGLLFATAREAADGIARGCMPPWSAVWYLEEDAGPRVP